ncbi:BPSS1780 family membrane protein [Zoogloea sp.]|uniref:BPSS1780 family membrane protein n=1 Tax=Zoogloea sp. TaxID=49181 RepID=UPI0035B39297
MTEPAPPAPHPYSSARHPQPRHVSPAESLVWLKAGWSFFMQSPGVWIAIAVIFIVMLFVLGLVPLLGWAVVLIGFPIMVAGMVLGCHALAQGQPLRVDHLAAGLKVHAGNLALVGVFYLLGGLVAGFVSVVVGGGALLTGYILGALAGLGLGLVSGVVLGSVVFSVLWVLLITALWFAAPLVVLRDTPPLDAMKLSLTACFNNFGAFVVLGVLIYVLIWVAMLPAGLGVLVLIPVLAGTLYASFQDVFGERPALPPAAQPEATPE